MDRDSEACLMLLLHSMAEYMNKTTEDIDGRPLLEGTLKIQEKAAAAVERRANGEESQHNCYNEAFEAESSGTSK